MEWIQKLLLKPPPAQKGEVNYAMVDRFTLVHFGIGFGYGAASFGVGTAIFLALAWELLENPLKVHMPKLFPHSTADTLQNAVGDVLAVLTGWVVSCPSRGDRGGPKDRDMISVQQGLS